MFSIFSSNERKSSLAFLKTDVHNHLLPGVDDGAKNPKESQRMLEKYHQLGIKKIVATPHINEDYFPNETAELQRAHEQLQKIVEQSEMDIRIELAAEYKTDELFLNRLSNKDLLPIAGRYLLIELPFFGPPLNWEQYFFKAQLAGYTPILAHAERFVYWKNEMDHFFKLKDKGVELQLNLGSLAGLYGKDVRSLALALINKGAYSWVGTDAHDVNMLDFIKDKVLSAWPTKLKAPQYLRNVEI